MAINFPTSLDNFTNPSSGNTLDSPSHSLQHSDSNDAIEAIEAKLGIGTSPAGSATSGQVLTAGTGGTTTWATPTAGGLIQIVPSSVAVGSGSGSANSAGYVSFTGASSVSLNDVFSATYDNYLILTNVTSTDASDKAVSFRLRVGGADNSTSVYYERYVGYTDFNSTDNFRNSAVTSWFLFPVDSTRTGADYSNSMQIRNPFLSVNTSHSATMNGNVQASGAQVTYIGGGLYNATTSFTGFSVIASTGTITGTIAVYAYRD